MSAIFVYCYLLGYQNICHHRLLSSGILEYLSSLIARLNAGIPTKDMTFSRVCKKDLSPQLSTYEHLSETLFSYATNLYYLKNIIIRQCLMRFKYISFELLFLI